jgi:hypothetical protein
MEGGAGEMSQTKHNPFLLLGIVAVCLGLIYYFGKQLITPEQKRHYLVVYQIKEYNDTITVGNQVVSAYWIDEEAIAKIRGMVKGIYEKTNKSVLITNIIPLK